MKARLLVLLASMWFRVADADTLPDYIRHSEEARSSRLESAIRTFSLPSGQVVDLIGVVHIADDAAANHSAGGDSTKLVPAGQ